MIRRTALLLATVLGFTLTAALLPTPAAALPLVAEPRILMLGDSITWQVCTDRLMRYGDDAPQYLKDRDGGCYGWSGATTADMSFMVGGGRFLSNGPGQPHPKFDERGQTNPWSVREAIDRADVLVMGLGTNDSGRGCPSSEPSPWPVQIPDQMGNTFSPCGQTPAEFRQQIEFYVWLAQGRPVFWFDIAVTNPSDPAYARQQDYNDVIWGSAGRHPNFHPIAWARAVAAHPTWLRADGVHLNSPAGNQGRYSTLMAALRGCGY